MRHTTTGARFRRQEPGGRLLHRLTTLILTAVTAFFSIGAAEQAHSAEDRRVPNIVLILADDLGYGDLSCYGHAQFKTPHLDRMAEEGARLTQFYVPVPYCAPSRATLLTGRYPWRNGVMRNPAPDSGINDVGIPAGELTLGEMFQSAGYATCCIGKWHLGHRPEFLPRRHGFDEYLGILYSNDMRPVQLIDGEQVVEYPVVQALLTQKYTARALDFIERNRERPFLLYLPHAMPHKPLAASEAFYKKSGGGLYGDVMAELDWSVGRLLAKLKELNLDERTLVVFTSDNGPWFGGSTGGLRGMKGNSWDGGIRVPMIARWPGKIPPGQTLDTLCGSIDLFPTALKAAGIPVPQDRVIDGRDIMPLLASKAESPHEALYAMRGGNLMTVRSGKWKLHGRTPGRSRYLKNADDWVDPRAPDGVTLLAPYEQYRPNQFPGVLTGDPPAEWMLFDVESDPAEQHNVAAEHPDVVARLKALFEDMEQHVPLPPRAAPKPKPAPKQNTPARAAAPTQPRWKKHEVHAGFHTNTAVAADFTGDGKTDVISNSGGKTRLFVAPDWREVILDETEGRNCIHSEVMDVDADGDPDWIGARYQPGLVFWLERPGRPLEQPWKYHLIDDEINGIHGLLAGDVDGDGVADLLANSAQPSGKFPNSLAWLRIPKDPRNAERWERYIFANKDAPGLSHYLGLGDVNGDGRPDAASAAKGGPMAQPGTGDWFAWWEAPQDPKATWRKHLISDEQPGATNVHPADVNGDGKVDFLASRGHGQGVVWFEAPDWTAHAIHPTLAGPHCLVVTDLDGDGDIDAATCAKDDQQVAWFENDGRGKFTNHTIGLEQAAYDIRAADMDGDGDLDLLIAGHASQNVVWYENPKK